MFGHIAVRKNGQSFMHQRILMRPYQDRRSAVRLDGIDLVAELIKLLTIEFSVPAPVPESERPFISAGAFWKLPPAGSRRRLYPDRALVFENLRPQQKCRLRQMASCIRANELAR
jgi:hypothetical protein